MPLTAPLLARIVPRPLAASRDRGLAAGRAIWRLPGRERIQALEDEAELFGRQAETGRGAGIAPDGALEIAVLDAARQPVDLVAERGHGTDAKDPVAVRRLRLGPCPT